MLERLEDIRSLGLNLDQIRPVRPHLKIAYSSAVAIEGALTSVSRQEVRSLPSSAWESSRLPALRSRPLRSPSTS